MSDDLKVGRIVFDKNTVYAGTGVSCNPLEYAPRGTIEELYKAQARIEALDTQLAAANKRLAELASEDMVLVLRDDLQLMKSWFAGGTEEMWAAMDRITAAMEKAS